METRKMKLALSAGALALSLALAGCGGGGSAGAPAGPTAAQMQTTAIMDAIKAAQMAVAAIDNASPTQAQVTAAKSAVEAADMAVEAADDVDADTVARHRATVMAWDNAVKLAQSAVDAGTSVDAAKQAQADAEAAQKKAEDDLAAKEEADRKAKEEADRKTMMAKLDKLAMAIGTTGFTERTNTDKPEKAMDLDAPHAISGWNGASYSLTAGKDVTTTVVYDNKEAPTSVAFDKKHTVSDANAAKPGTVMIAGSNDALRKLIDIPGLPANVNHPGVQVGPVVGVPGTFDGVSGVFTTSINAGFQVGVDTNGDPMWTGGALHFKPDSATAMVDMPDANYMSLGWWLAENKDTGITGVEVAAWATGAAYDGQTATKLVSLQGKATFEGIAVGKYTHKTTTTTTTDIAGGHFNADAMLEADFDTETLRGTIDNFMQDGMSIGDGWKVELGAMATPFDPMTGADMTVTSATESGVTDANGNMGAMGTFGNLKTMGSWNAMLVDNTRRDGMPGGVTGHFHIGAAGDPVNMVGAFATSNTVADQPKQ